MIKLELPVDSRGYTAKFGSPVIATQLDGGAPRYRKDKIGVVHIVDVVWVVGQDDYKYLLAFYRTATDQGSLPFTIDLLLDDSVTGEYQAFFVPETFLLESVSGLTYTVRAQLSVVPLVVDQDSDNQIIAMRSGSEPVQ